MRVEWNQYDGLSLAGDRRMKKKIVAKYFNTRENVITQNSDTSGKIFNIDESGINVRNKADSVLIEKGF